MAGVGGTGESSSVQEDEDCVKKTLSTLSEMCTRNGISNGCHCSEKSCRSLQGKLIEHSAKAVKLNGVTKTPSIPILRSRSERRTLPADSPRKKRRSPKLDKQGDRESPSAKVMSVCVNNNNESQKSVMERGIVGLLNNHHRTTTNHIHLRNHRQRRNHLSRHSRHIVNNLHQVGTTSPSSNSSPMCKGCHVAPTISSGSQDSRCHGNLTTNSDCSQSEHSSNGHVTRTSSGNSPSQVPCELAGKAPCSGGKCIKGKVSSKRVEDCLESLSESSYLCSGSIACGSDSLDGSTSGNHSGSNGDALTPPNSVCDDDTTSTKSNWDISSLFPPPHRNGLVLSVDAHCSGISNKLGSSTGGSTGGCMGPPPISPDNSRSCTPPASTTSSTHTASDDGKKSADITACQWSKCSMELNEADLMEHIRTKHVDTQVKNNSGKEDATFRCLWVGCKVYNKQSSSQSWLERHILSHSGDKPFKCIVDGCGLRFTSQGGLERHVNSHFNTYQHPNLHKQRSRDDTPSKLLKKRKLKRRKSWLIKTDDYFDARIMESIQHHLVEFSQHVHLDLNSNTANQVTFHSTVIARRTDDCGKVQVLLHWSPEHVLPDEWMSEKAARGQHRKTVATTSLPRDTAANLHASIYAQHRFRKHRRK